MNGEDEPQRRQSGWDALFGGPAATNRAERRAAEKELASRIRRNQRAHARRMKQEAKDGN